MSDLLFDSWVLPYVPTWFRSRWPLRRYFWQQDQIDRIKERAEEYARVFGRTSRRTKRPTS